MAEVKQSLQETGSKERESYKSVFLKSSRFVTVKACTLVERYKNVSCRL